MITGLLVHQTRQKPDVNCNSAFASLSLVCASSARSASRHTVATAAFGRDPAFNALAPQYNPDLEGRACEFYSTTVAAGEISPLGTPFAFFARTFPG